MYSYDGLKKELARREMTMTALGKAAGISSRTLAKISKGQKISSAVLRKMSIVLSCPVETLCREVSDNPVSVHSGKKESIIFPMAFIMNFRCV